MIYLEYFYFITSTMLLLMALNLIAYTLDKIKVFYFDENQVFNAFFIPLFFFAVLIVTLAKFY